MAEGEEKKGFTIRDRRSSAQTEEPAKAKGEKSKGEEAASKIREERIDRSAEPPHPLPEMNFSSFVFSLSTSALLHLGEIPDPITQERTRDLPLAKQTIDILGMLQEKTRGNLTPDEDQLMRHILADLRWRYVKEAKG